MTAEDLLDAYRDDMAPTLGRAFMEGYIARNRSTMLRMLAPLVALMNERMQAPRVSAPRREEDPDEVTPEKDAIVWAAFRSLVNEKRRAFGMQELDEVTESMPFFGRTCNTRALRDAEDRGRNAVYGANIADAGLTAAWRGMTESLPSRTPIAITLRHPKRRDLVAMVTASASEPGRYQLTWADNAGPSGHTTRDTPDGAVRHAVEEGYRLDTANSTEAREMVERVQRERERRAAEIESWLNESLPSPRHAGRMGDGFKVGEHVIRIGDMIKMEGQLGGYVENVDRSKGIARIEQDNGEIKTWPLASLLHDTAANRERQQEHNNQINAEAQARLERSLADWRAR